MKEVRRGYNPKDITEFNDKAYLTLALAAQEIYYFINRGYDIKSCSTFISNHYLLSERQRLALSRIISSEKSLLLRKAKLIELHTPQETVHIDGFNTIITLETALSHCLLIQGLDHTIRDLASLRGTYRINDKTSDAISLIFNHFENVKLKHAIFYLDKPVSNSGRLKQLIMEIAENYNLSTTVNVVDNVDRLLYTCTNVITSDAIILDNCISWYNLNNHIIKYNLTNSWIFKFDLDALK